MLPALPAACPEAIPLPRAVQDSPTSLYTEFPARWTATLEASVLIRASKNQSIDRSKSLMPRTAARAITAAPHRPSRRQFNEKMPSGRIVDIPTYEGVKLKGTVYSAGENRPCVVMASGVCTGIPKLSIPIRVSRLRHYQLCIVHGNKRAEPPAPRYGIDLSLVLWFATPLLA